MLPNNALSSVPLPAPFLYPRNTVRFSQAAGQFDVHYGGIAIGDASQGLSYQVWQAYSDGTNVLLTAPNTAPFIQLANVNPVWISLAFDQNARPFIGYVTANGNAFYYWFDTIANAFVTSELSSGGSYKRIFSALDDLRPGNTSGSDIILAYTRGGQLYIRVQRDRYGVEYDLAALPEGQLVQIGMNLKWRFQFGFQGIQTNTGGLPPAEYAPYLGINEPA